MPNPQPASNDHTMLETVLANLPVPDALDQAVTCQENIFAMALLLEDSGSHAALDEQERLILTGTGRLIAIEARKLKILLERLEQHYSRPAQGARAKRKN